MTSLAEAAADTIGALRRADAEQRSHYPGDAPPGPVHTVYVNADAFSPATLDDLRAQARAAFARHGATPGTFAHALGVEGWDTAPTAKQEAEDATALERDPGRVEAERPEVWLAHQVHARVRRRLAGPLVQDLRIDFEDGYGARPDEEEDADAIRCAQAIARLGEAGGLCPRIGIRIEPLDTPNVARAVRTLERFVDTLVEATGGASPAELVITVPKVSHAAQSRAAAELLATLEQRHGLPADRLRLELMVEQGAALIGPDGRCPLPGIVEAGGSRVIGVPLGVYDFTASSGLAPGQQAPDHPLCDLARGIMRLALAGTGVAISDGATNVLPVGARPTGELTAAELDDDRVAVHRGWRLSHRHVGHALARGIYQGWDMHGAQLPARYAALYRFFVAGWPEAARRLRSILADLSAAQHEGAALDDAATAEALYGFVRRAYECGAIDADELRFAGLRAGETEHRSFAALAIARCTRT